MYLTHYFYLPLEEFEVFLLSFYARLHHNLLEDMSVDGPQLGITAGYKTRKKNMNVLMNVTLMENVIMDRETYYTPMFTLS